MTVGFALTEAASSDASKTIQAAELERNVFDFAKSEVNRATLRLPGSQRPTKKSTEPANFTPQMSYY